MIQVNRLKKKQEFDIQDLLEIMEILRSENGCPWDKEQTHATIRSNVIEEAYEVADAIDSADSEALCEELGDLLLQVVFHAQMAKEISEFDFNRVANNICKKLILRHPHIFADTVAETSEKVLSNWDAIKKVEKQHTTYTDTLNAVPKAFPAAMRAEKVQKRAAKAGFDWDDISGALDKVKEEYGELEEAVEQDNKELAAEELGDLLFSCVNVARFLKVDSEQTLSQATDKFIGRFQLVEELALKKGVDMQSASLEELDGLWNEIKKK